MRERAKPLFASRIAAISASFGSSWRDGEARQRSCNADGDVVQQLAGDCCLPFGAVHDARRNPAGLAAAFQAATVTIATRYGRNASHRNFGRLGPSYFRRASTRANEAIADILIS
jgi:hypothetical protein